jgi:hypothetical protein
MNSDYRQYLELYGNFSHILNIKISNGLSEDEKQQILLDIQELIHEKEITKTISNMNISVKWRTMDLYQYYTDGNGILSDKGIHAHTKLLLTDINTIRNKRYLHNVNVSYT